MENTHLDPTRASPPRTPLGPAPVAPHTPLHPLRSLGEFRILRQLGEGGMGTVYLAYEGKHDRQVALKVLNEQFAGNQGYIDRFYREARSGSLLNHPNIVRTYTAGQDRITGKHYLVMEYVDGPSAHALLDHAGCLVVGDAVHIALDVARALEHAHSRNIIHRDIKPDNILLTRSGVSKLGDLGLAKRVDDPGHLTAVRQGFGTTAYMPYEQAIAAKSADGRSDIYALGATFYHLLTGKVPFPGENHLEVVEKKNVGHFLAAGMLNAEVPPVLDRILAQMLARQPRDRYQTASELIIDLERSRLSNPVPSFADPELARNDPWLQACMTTGEPTRLDPEHPPEKASGDTAEWVVRYHTKAGRSVTVRLHTDQVIKRLEAGTLPIEAEARHPGAEAFSSITTINEFREVIPAPREEEPQEQPSAPDSPLRRVMRWLFRS